MFGQVRKSAYLCRRKNYTNEHYSIMYSYEYPRPALTADAVVLSFNGRNLEILLIQRGIEPFKGSWALPGGFMKMDETIEQCTARELEEETSLTGVYLQQFGCFSTVNRDPRGRVVTVASYALVHKAEVKGGDDAAEARWFEVDYLPELAFDHHIIVAKAMERLREDIHFRPVGFQLLNQTFTMPELQHIYEAILNKSFDRRNFAKKMLTTQVVEDADKEEPTCCCDCPPEPSGMGKLKFCALPGTEREEESKSRARRKFRFSMKNYFSLKDSDSNEF